MSDPFLKPEHVQGSVEWLAHRMNFIGASEAAIIMGLSPWKTPYQLWEDKLGLSKPDEENFAMKRGSAMEPVAREAFERETGFSVFPFIVYHKEHDFMMASLDGLSLDGQTAVEIKCPGAKAHNMALEGIVPEYYMPQLQHQLACIGGDLIWYYSFDGENGVALQVPRDDEYIKLMIEKEEEFWEMVRTETPPPFTEKDYQVRDSATWSAYSHRVSEIDALLSSLKDERDSIKEALLEDSNGRSSRCGSLTLTKSFPRGSIDYSAIIELDGVDLEKYRKKSRVQWTLKVAKRK